MSEHNVPKIYIPGLAQPAPRKYKVTLGHAGRSPLRQTAESVEAQYGFFRDATQYMDEPGITNIQVAARVALCASELDHVFCVTQKTGILGRIFGGLK